MGFTGLARWINAPPTGLELVKQNITRNHNGIDRGRWLLTIRSYRSIFTTSNSNSGRTSQLTNLDRNMCALTMNDNVFVLLEDPAAPTRAEFLQSQSQAQAQSQAHGHHHMHRQAIDPPHYRHTFVTVGPPGALEQLLAQLRARWLSTRQASSLNSTIGGRSQNQASSSHQLSIDGHIFSIGSDWLVRVGNVVLAGGAVRGMLLEAEYLPLSIIHLQTADETSEMLSNLLTSILPNVPNARTVAVTISEAQWDEVLWNSRIPNDHLQPVPVPEEVKLKSQSTTTQSANETNDSDMVEKMNENDDDDIMVYGNDEDHDAMLQSKGDWVGLDRDKRSAYLIIGALKSEGII